MDDEVKELEQDLGDKTLVLGRKPKEGLGPNIKVERGSARWDNTVIVKNRLHESGFLEEPDAEALHGYFKGRPIIGRDSRINGGIYVGSGKREAIVIDDNKSESLREVYEDLQELIVGRTSVEGVLQLIYELTNRYIPYDERAVDDINLEHNLSNDAKVSLGVYMGRGGVCRHQALLSGYLLEKMIDEGKLPGEVSIDRNSVKGVGGHAWVRYNQNPTSKDLNSISIIDPAQKYIGKLSQIPSDAWFYMRPSDSRNKK